MLPIEPDDICIPLVYWEDVFIPELAHAAIEFIAEYPPDQLDAAIAASAVYALNFISEN